ncbi:MAG TPA: TasA family protein [Candidatus Dormibacteraeota bacterium]|nr:TasA family protein [Candidatus Dormibacteraeota bacterium]
MSKKRLLLTAGGITTVAAAGMLVAGTTFGLFSSTPASESNNFTAGTVTLSSDATGVCSTATNIAPGDGSACTFKASYNGSLDAFLGLDVLIETQHATASGSGGTAHGGTNLYKPTDSSNDLQVTITDDKAVSYTVPTVATTCVGAPAGSTCYELDNELVSSTADAGGSTTNHTFTVTWSLPSSAGNGYQGGTAQVILTAHAVQAANQPTDSTTPGSSDSTLTWS